MATKKNKKEENATSKERYARMLYSVLKRRDTLMLADKMGRFNDTEIQLLVAILDAKYDGKRVISTQLAKALGITRAAVSQMVNRLEREGVVNRVADDVDRKIAYIELSEEVQALYEKDLKEYMDRVGQVVEKFGAERFETLYALIDEFLTLVEEEKALFQKK